MTVFGPSGTFDQIQTAINTVAADPLGGSVIVLPGIYTPGAVFGLTIPAPLSTAPSPPFSLSGGGLYPSQTVLNGGSAGLAPGITVSPGWDTSLLITNFRIINCGAGLLGPPGGGMLIDDASPQIVSNEIVCNQAGLTGGGIACIAGAAPYVYDNFIGYNVSVGSGGGISIEDGAGHLELNILEANVTVDGVGGGLFLDSSTPFALDNVFDRNAGRRGGGGIACADGSDAVFSANIIKSNETTGSFPGGGGGAQVFDSAPEFYSNVFSGNTVDDETGGGEGGGLYISGSDVLLMHNTLHENEAESAGGGLYVEGSTVRLYNSILWDNSVVAGTEPEIFGVTTQFTIRNCNIKDGFWVDQDPTSPGSINMDPVFATPANTLAPDYHLTLQSPCIDRGIVDMNVPGGVIDVDLDPRRPLCGGVYDAPDIGADEFFPTIYIEVDETASYTNATVLDGTTVNVRVAGPSGAWVFIGASTNLLFPGLNLPYCNTNWVLDPNAGTLQGPFFIPTSGILDISWLVSGSPALAALQALVGPEAEQVATRFDRLQILPSVEAYPNGCGVSELLENITPITVCPPGP